MYFVEQTDDLRWFKADASGGGNDCVEIAVSGNQVHMRSSEDRRAQVTFTRREMAMFFDGVKAGDFNKLI